MIYLLISRPNPWQPRPGAVVTSVPTNHKAEGAGPRVTMATVAVVTLTHRFPCVFLTLPRDDDWPPLLLPPPPLLLLLLLLPPPPPPPPLLIDDASVSWGMGSVDA